MKLPHLDNAYVPEEKITLYLLNLQHPKGRGKAKFFTQFGFSVAQWKQLADALMNHAQSHEVVKTEQTKFGIRYVIEGELQTPIERKPQVRVVWFSPTDSTQPHLVTAYPLEGSDD
ncbi:MAG: hypothetical protein EA396_15170 [Anaerolineaceae bacterium]|nr:MAG: hypothetical protein EA396_15170 [Anaerolineaceae bacterium]